MGEFATCVLRQRAPPARVPRTVCTLCLLSPSLHPPLLHPRPQLPSCPCRLPLLVSAHLPGLSLVFCSILISLWPPLTQPRGELELIQPHPLLLERPWGPSQPPTHSPMHCSAELFVTHVSCCLSPAFPSILQAVKPLGSLPQ